MVYFDIEEKPRLTDSAGLGDPGKGFHLFDVRENPHKIYSNSLSVVSDV